MSLDRYKAKRNFKRTSEPSGGQTTSDKLAFVVQQHHASHQHFDFRLEIRGVLFSWAVPKGPSMDQNVRRLAQPTEDHPFDYLHFEGIIPQGQYGGGTVIVWDTGYYEPIADKPLKTKDEKEHLMHKQYFAGDLRFTLHGYKLKGEFLLTRMKEDTESEGSWRLIKKDDMYATEEDVLIQNKSVMSGLTIEEMAQNSSARTWHSNKFLKRGKRSAMPISIAPMLCTLTKEPIQSDEYIHELKWDGYRIVSLVKGKSIRMASRSGLDYTSKYPPLVQALKELDREVVLDGEVVVFNEDAKPDFDALQKFNGHDGPINYCLFDILWLDGYDLTSLTLLERRQVLSELIKGHTSLRDSPLFEDGNDLYNQCIELGFEGIVSKRKTSTYQSGARNADWLKTPTRKRQEFVIGGWAESDKARSFRSLLFGAYRDGRFEWVGRSGGGYKEKDMPSILKALKELEINNSPFVNKVMDTKGATLHWVKPELVANFEFATWTKSGRIRKPATFIGFRKDKKPEQVVREVPLSDNVQQSIEERPVDELPEQYESNWPRILNRKIRSSGSINISGYEVEIDNIDDELWPGVLKKDLIEYYAKVSPYLLPYIKDRPISPYIKDQGVHQKGFYQKDMDNHAPLFVDIFRDTRRNPTKGKRPVIDYAVINNEAALIYFINMGSIDINPWATTTQRPTMPDYISIDIDPPDAKKFDKVVTATLVTKEVLDKYKLTSLVKTSGKTGMHIFIPCLGLSTGQAKLIAKQFYKEIHQLVPDLVTDEFNINRREGKIFIDYTMNDYTKTLASVYSCRPNHTPTVSSPLQWAEVKPSLHPELFTINNIFKRLKEHGDLFSSLFDKNVRVSNSKLLKKLQYDRN